MKTARRLLQISAKHWLQACVAATIAAFVFNLVAEAVGALFILLAFLALLFAAAAFIKSILARKTESREEGAE